MAKKKVTGAGDAGEVAEANAAPVKKTAKKAAKKSAAAPATPVASAVDTDAAAKLAAMMIAKRNLLQTSGGKSAAFKPTSGGLPASLGGTGSLLGDMKKGEAHASRGAIGRQQTGANQNRFIPRRTSG